MLSRLKNGVRRPYNKTSHDLELPKISALLPRLWMILLVLAAPFFVNSARYFESLERSGTAGAIIADTVFPATFVSYLVLVYVLRRRKI